MHEYKVFLGLPKKICNKNRKCVRKNLPELWTWCPKIFSLLHHCTTFEGEFSSCCLCLKTARQQKNELPWHQQLLYRDSHPMVTNLVLLVALRAISLLTIMHKCGNTDSK